MRKKEQRVWDSLKRNKPRHIELERIENLVGEGIPDVFVCALARMAWCELKAATVPARASTRLLGSEGLRVSQLNWHSTARHFRLPVYTLIRDDSKLLYLVHCDHSEELNEMTQAEVAAVSVASSWEEIYTVFEKGSSYEN